MSSSNPSTSLRLGIIASRFNQVVTDRLVAGARKAAEEEGLPESEVLLVRVAGAWEIPTFAELLARRGTFDALVCLGAIVRGETQHHDYLGHAIFGTLQRLQTEHLLPIAVGILTTENMEQALARSGDDPGNKGYESVKTALECARLRRQLG